MFSHVMTRVSDVDRALAVYRAVLAQRRFGCRFIHGAA